MIGFDAAIRFRYLGGGRGLRRGRFAAPWPTIPQGCGIGAPEHGGLIVYRGGRRFEVAPGAVLLTPQGVRQRVTDNGSPEFRQQWARVDFTLFGTVDLFSLLELPDTLAGAAAALASEQVSALNAIAGGHARLDLAALVRREEAGFRLLRLLVEHGATASGLKARLLAIERLQPVLRVMEARLADRLDRPALAREAGVSPSRLHTLFVTALGESPYAYLTRLRLRRAQELLVGSDQSVQRVAETAGFGDAFHFSRSFRHAFGASPRDYRKQARAEW